jgi:hypothetical protein
LRASLLAVLNFFEGRPDLLQFEQVSGQSTACSADWAPLGLLSIVVYDGALPPQAVVPSTVKTNMPLNRYPDRF